MKKILILGGGFGGLVTAERLAATIGEEHRITLVSPNRKFTFYPALVRLAFGQLAEEEVTFDLGKKLRKLNVRFVEAEVLHLKPQLHRVQVAGKEFNGDLSYDLLVIAIGRRLATEKMPGFFDNAHHLLGIRSAKKFGRAVDEFGGGTIVVGLSPGSFLPVPVCETAFMLANRMFPDSPRNPVRIRVVFPETVADAFGGAEIRTELERSFEKNGIELVENFPIGRVGDRTLTARDGREMEFDLLMLVPPFRGQARLSENGITDPHKFVEVDNYLRVEGMNDAYAVGDIVSYPGPKLAHVAVRQAAVAAKNIAAGLEGREPDEVYYHEIAAVLDQGGADSIYLHYGFWDDTVYNLKKGTLWGVFKRVHDKIWRTRHKVV